jgi:hypothetical protein
LAAAGIVVTEIKTPTKAPDLAEVSACTRVMPARKPTIHEGASGFQMKLVSGRSAISMDRLRKPEGGQDPRQDHSRRHPDDKA